MEPTVKEGAALLARATGWLSWIAANWRKPAAVMVVTGGIAGGVTEFGHYAGGLAEFYKLVYEWVYVPIHGPVPASASGHQAAGRSTHHSPPPHSDPPNAETSAR